MGLFVSSTSAASRHDVYAIKKTPQSQLRARGTGVVAIVGAFPWGPDKQLVQPPDLASAKLLFAPPGMPRTGYAYLSLLAKSFPDLRIVRVIGGSGAATASATLTATATNILTVSAKYKGVAGNSITVTVSNATDADANHFDMTITVTGLSGTTTDVIRNYNVSGTGADTVLSPDDLNRLQLVAQPTKVNAGRPDNGTYSMTTGSDGTVVASDYVGTAGSGDKGLSILEGDRAIRHVTVGYPGSSLLAAVNAGLVAHAVLMGDRFVYLSFTPGAALSAVQSDVATYRGVGVEYIDPWVYIYDDTTAALQLVPGTHFAASVAAQLSPSTSPAWKNTEVKTMLSGIVKLEAQRGMGAASNSTQGIWTLIRETTGGHTFEAAVNTIAPADPANTLVTTTAMDIYIASAFVDSVRGSVDAPNVPLNRDDLRVALDGFMSTLKKNQAKDPNHTPHVLDYFIAPMESANTQQDIAAGNVFVSLTVQYSRGMERIFLVMQSGTGAITVQRQ